MRRTWVYLITLSLSAFLIVLLTSRGDNTGLDKLAAGPCDPSISLCL